MTDAKAASNLLARLEAKSDWTIAWRAAAEIRALQSRIGELTTRLAEAGFGKDTLDTIEELTQQLAALQSKLSTVEIERDEAKRQATHWEQQAHTAAIQRDEAYQLDVCQERDRLKAALAATRNARDRAREALKELHAVVMGECSALLDEDRGGSAHLAFEIEAILAEQGEGT